MLLVTDVSCGKPKSVPRPTENFSFIHKNSVGWRVRGKRLRAHFPNAYAKQTCVLAVDLVFLLPTHQRSLFAALGVVGRDLAQIGIEQLLAARLLAAALGLDGHEHGIDLR